MSSKLNKLVNSIVKQPNKSSKNARKPRVKGKRLPNNRKRRTNIVGGRRIAAASAQSFRKKFTMLRQNGNSVRVTGRDLIYSIPDDLTSPIQDTNVITVIPANPAYWKGTRIAALASGYQNYRPIIFKVTYIPMCAVTQQGNVIGGTIWDDGIDNDNLQQSLRTSNGGFMTQCYVPYTTQIRPKSNLQFNLYRMGGEFSTTSNPFIFIALAIGCKNINNQRITPGYFYVTWSFELKNPIGSINSYNNTGLTTYNNLKLDMNNTIININPNSEVPFGAYIDVEEGDQNQPIPMYNGTPLEIAGTTPIWAFTSVTKNSNTKTIAKQVITYNGVTTSEIRLGYQGYLAYITTTEDHYDIYVPMTTFTNNSWRIAQTDTVLLVSNVQQNFGVIAGLEQKQVTVYRGEEEQGSQSATFTHYIASKEYYTTQLTNTTNSVNNKPQPPKIYIKKALLPKIQEQHDNEEHEEQDDIPEDQTLISRSESNADISIKGK